MGANVAQCKICGERMGWASGKAYGGPAGDVGQVVGAMLAIQEVVDPSDPNYQKLGEFIETGAALSKALHEAAHSRGMVPDREQWRRCCGEHMKGCCEPATWRQRSIADGSTQ